MEFFKVDGKGRQDEPDHEVQTACPRCGKEAILQSTDLMDLFYYSELEITLVGLRKCPILKCSTLVFFMGRRPSENPSEFSYTFFPRVRIEFNKAEIPDNVLKIFAEAVDCHANGCFTASAIMIRRTMEEICNDKGAKGKDLYKRIEALESTIIIHADLFKGMHELRLLGGDAAHVDLKHFDEIGEREAGLAIKITKEILKAVYQTAVLLQEIGDLKASSKKH